MNRCRFYPYLRTDKLSPKSGLAPMYLQCTVNGEYFKVSLDCYLPPSAWDSSKKQIIGKEYKILQHKINDGIAQANKIFQRFDNSDRLLNKEEFIAHFEKRYNLDSFLDFYQEQMDLRKASGTIEKATYSTNKTTLDLLKEFRPKGVRFAEVNVQFISEFKKWNQDRIAKWADKMHIRQKNGSINRVGKILANLKTYITLAQSVGIVQNNPFSFGRVKIQSVDGERTNLKQWELHSLVELFEAHSLPYREHEALRELLFGCYSSLRFSDVIAFSKSENIIDNNISYIAVKNKRFGRKVIVPMSDEVKKYLPVNDRFAKFTNKDMNDLLKIIAAKARIESYLTFHVSRHTFATMYLASGGLLHNLQSLLGHRNINETMKYVHTDELIKLKEMMAMGKFLRIPIQPFMSVVS